MQFLNPENINEPEETWWGFSWTFKQPRVGSSSSKTQRFLQNKKNPKKPPDDEAAEITVNILSSFCWWNRSCPVSCCCLFTVDVSDQIKYTGFRDRPHDERQTRFQNACRDGRSEVVSTKTFYYYYYYFHNKKVATPKKKEKIRVMKYNDIQVWKHSQWI